MKIFIDAFGDIALLCIRQLFEQKDFNARDFLVRTYSINSNDNLIDYLKDKEINYFITDYDELSIEKIISVALRASTSSLNSIGFDDAR